MGGLVRKGTVICRIRQRWRREPKRKKVMTDSKKKGSVRVTGIGEGDEKKGL